MSWKKVGDLAAVVGKYQKDGQEKNRYQNCGVMLKSEDGRCCIKLTCLPFKDDGMMANFYSIFPVEQKEQQKPAPAPKPAADDFDDSIPF